MREDDFEGYRHAVYVQTCKLFADLERMRQNKEAQEMHERCVVIRMRVRFYKRSSPIHKLEFLITWLQYLMTCVTCCCLLFAHAQEAESGRGGGRARAEEDRQRVEEKLRGASSSRLSHVLGSDVVISFRRVDTLLSPSL